MSGRRNEPPRPEPDAAFRDASGRTEAAVWRRRDSEGRETYHITLTKSYYADGEWRKCSTFSEKEFADVQKCAAKAQGWILEQKRDRAREGANVEDGRARDRQSLRGQRPGRPARRERDQDRTPAPPGRVLQEGEGGRGGRQDPTEPRTVSRSSLEKLDRLFDQLRDRGLLEQLLDRQEKGRDRGGNSR